jgi:hypothetical protein
MQYFANQVMRFMAYRGSAPAFLSFKPIAGRSIVNLDTKDSNGHQWPAYAYTRELMPNATGTYEPVAIPLKNAWLEYPNNWRLYYR